MLRRILLLLACLGFAQAGHAGGGSRQDLAVQFAVEDIASFSKQVERTLAEKRALVAIVARNGRPPTQLPAGVRYTHVGFAVYSEIGLRDGKSQRGYAFHNLYQSAQQPDQSELVVDFALDFFAGVSEMKAGIIIPQPALQQRLFNVIFDDAYRQLHNPRYSAIANPFNSRFQNCTEFVMNVTQSAIYGTGSIREVKANLRKWFDPYVLPYSNAEMAFAAMTNSDVAIDDQRFPFVTATYTSIVEYMSEYGLAADVIELAEPEAVPLLRYDLREDELLVRDAR